MPTLGPVFDPLPEDPDDRDGGGRPARRPPGPARPRRHPRLQPLVRARGADGPAGADPDRALAEGGPVIDRADRGKLLFLGSIAVSAVLVLAYLAAGGSDYAPAKTQDPCKPREWRNPEGLQEIAQQFSLSALDGAACKLGVSRETLAQALATRRVPPGIRRALRRRRRRAGAGDPRRPAAGDRRRRRSRRPEPAARRAPAPGPALDPARPGDRTGQQRPLAARRRGSFLGLGETGRHPRRIPALRRRLLRFASGAATS